MKRMFSIFCCLVTMLTTILFIPQASAASNAQTFANTALAEVGKTGRDLGYTDEWCAMFVKRCADRAGIGSSVPAQDNTAAMALWFHQNQRFALTRRNSSGVIECWTRGTWSSNLPVANYNFSPTVGDIAFFETNKIVADGIDHVGIVVSVSDNMVTVVEGNTGNSNNVLSEVSKNSYNWKQNNSKIWGFARPQACGSMNSAASGITNGPIAKITTNSRSCTAVLQWNKIANADYYEFELYDAAGWQELKNGASGVYLQKNYNITGTSYTISGLERGKTYYVQIAACNKAGQWKFGPSASFTIPNSSTTSASSKTTIASLIASKTCRGYLCVSSNQKAYTNAALTGFDNSYVYASDYIRVVRAEGNSLLVEYPAGSGTKQRWITASKVFCNYSYAVWSKTVTQYITVTARAGGGSKVGTVYPKDLVYILGETNGYYQLLYPAGSIWKFGFAPKSVVK